MLKKTLFAGAIFIIFIFVIIIDESVTTKTYKENIQKIQASGILYQALNQKQTFFNFTSKFRLALDKTALISHLLLHLPKQKNITSVVSQLEGMVFEITTKRHRYMFDHTFSSTVKIITLPTNYQFESTLIKEIKQFLLQHSNLITLDYNIYHNTFDLSVDTLNHIFLADNNISYSILLKNAHFHADFEEISRPKYAVKAAALQTILLKNNISIASFSTHNPSISFDTTTEQNSVYSFATGSISLDFNAPTQTLLSADSITFSQQQKSDKMVNYYSQLAISNANLQSKENIIFFQNFSYDIALEGMLKHDLQSLKYLLASVNSNNVLYIYQDISNAVKKLLDHAITIKCSTLSLNNLTVNKELFYDTKLSFTAKAYQQNPLELEMDLSLSQPMYHFITTQIPNADLLDNYIEDSNASTLAFTLSYAKNTLSINHKNIPLPKVETNTTQRISHEKSH